MCWFRNTYVHLIIIRCGWRLQNWTSNCSYHQFLSICLLKKHIDKNAGVTTMQWQNSTFTGYVYKNTQYVAKPIRILYRLVRYFLLWVRHPHFSYGSDTLFLLTRVPHLHFWAINGFIRETPPSIWCMLKVIKATKITKLSRMSPFINLYLIASMHSCR